MSPKNTKLFNVIRRKQRARYSMYIPDVKYVICHLYENLMSTHSTNKFDKCCIYVVCAPLIL